MSFLLAGIVQGKGKVAQVDSKNNFSTILIRFPDNKLRGAEVGASIAINGTCLTVSRKLVLTAAKHKSRTLLCIHERRGKSIMAVIRTGL